MISHETAKDISSPFFSWNKIHLCRSIHSMFLSIQSHSAASIAKWSVWLRKAKSVVKHTFYVASNAHELKLMRHCIHVADGFIPGIANPCERSRNHRIESLVLCVLLLSNDLKCGFVLLSYCTHRRTHIVQQCQQKATANTAIRRDLNIRQRT